jgi:hypothetical protein
VAAGQLEHSVPAVVGQRHSGRVLEVRHEVEEIDAMLFSVKTLEHLDKGVRVQP